MAMAMAPCTGDPIVLVRDSFKHYIEAVLQHLTELQRRWHPVDVPRKWASLKQVEELAALCRECGLASAKAVVACDRVLRRQIQEPQKNCDRSRLEDSPAAATDQREELRQLMAKRLQRAFRGFQQRRRRSKQKAAKFWPLRWSAALRRKYSKAYITGAPESLGSMLQVSLQRLRKAGCLDDVHTELRSSSMHFAALKTSGASG